MSEQIYNITTKTSVPPRTEVAGCTIETVGTRIIPTGGDLREVLHSGDWIVGLDQDQCRLVDHVRFDSRGQLVYPFTTDIPAGTPLRIVRKDDAKVLYVLLQNIGGSDTTINGQPVLLADDFKEYGQPNPGGRQYNLVEPKVVDGATSEVTVNIEAYGNQYYSRG
jgi:hypothetical protein